MLASFDSFVKAAMAVAGTFEAAGAQASLALVRSRRRQVSPSQKRALGLSDEIEPLPMRDLVRGHAFQTADIVISALDGRRSRSLFAEMHAAGHGASRPRPLIASVYPGVVFRDHLDGFMDRAPADVICFNTEGDQRQYLDAAAALGMDGSNAVVTGLLMLSRVKRSADPGRSRRIVFFDQPTVPRHRLQRRYLLDALLDLADRLPDRMILVKPRIRRGEETLHRTRFHLEDLAETTFKARRRPPNFSFSHEPVESLLQDARLALTISSTVALEACLAGVPLGIVADFGIAEHLGNHYFAGSGCFLRLADVERHEPLVARPEWLADSGAALAPERLIGKVADLLAKRDTADGLLPLRPQHPANGSEDYFRFAMRHAGIPGIVNPEIDDFDLRSLIQAGYQGLISRMPPLRASLRRRRSE